MTALTGPFYAATLLLAIAGAVKIARPDATADTLTTVRVPAARPAARVLGLAEVAVAIAALTGSRAGAVALALAYVGLAGFAALARDRQAGCGCFGVTEAQVTGVHVAVNLGLAAVATAVAVEPLGAPTDVLADSPLGGLLLAVLAVVTTYLLYLVLVGHAGPRPAERSTR